MSEPREQLERLRQAREVYIRSRQDYDEHLYRAVKEGASTRAMANASKMSYDAMRMYIKRRGWNT